MTKIKFCGLRTENDIMLVNRIHPDFAGFILSKRFWRYASDFEKIRPLLKKDIAAVGVFVDNPLEEAANYIKRGIIDYAQLHGSEDEEYIKCLQRIGGKVIKAFKITSEDDINRAFSSPADMVLLDSGTGTGEQFDWRLITNFKRDYFLAGGLTPENAAEAVEKFHPYALDVSSGVETDKIKDGAKMLKFADAVRNIQKIKGEERYVK